MTAEISTLPFPEPHVSPTIRELIELGPPMLLIVAPVEAVQPLLSVTVTL